MNFVTRPNTSDHNIFRSITEFNEYRLPTTLSKDDVIVDIGTHIGSFSYACALKGAGRIVSFEAWEDNFKIANANLTVLNNFPATVYNKAVWRSDLDVMPDLHFQKSSDQSNTGGGNVLFQSEGLVVSTISLDSIIDTCCDGKQISILKLDCEGSEFPILLSSKKLHKVDAICGEYHEMGGAYNAMRAIPTLAQVGEYKEYTIEVLTDFLTQQGFKVEHFRHGTTNLGMFFATR